MLVFHQPTHSVGRKPLLYWNIPGVNRYDWTCLTHINILYLFLIFIEMLTACVVVHLGFRNWIYSVLLALLSLTLNICNFQLVSHIAQKVIDLQSRNFTGMLLSMCIWHLCIFVRICLVFVELMPLT
jgi:hypothetical protein